MARLWNSHRHRQASPPRPGVIYNIKKTPCFFFLVETGDKCTGLLGSTASWRASHLLCCNTEALPLGVFYLVLQEILTKISTLKYFVSRSRLMNIFDALPPGICRRVHRFNVQQKLNETNGIAAFAGFPQFISLLPHSPPSGRSGGSAGGRPGAGSSENPL